VVGLMRRAKGETQRFADWGRVGPGRVGGIVTATSIFAELPSGAIVARELLHTAASLRLIRAHPRVSCVKFIHGFFLRGRVPWCWRSRPCAAQPWRRWEQLPASAPSAPCRLQLLMPQRNAAPFNQERPLPPGLRPIPPLKTPRPTLDGRLILPVSARLAEAPGHPGQGLDLDRTNRCRADRASLLASATARLKDNHL